MGTRLRVTTTKARTRLSLAIEWFENNYMKLNDDKCHLLISGFKYQSHWAMVGTSKIEKVSMKNY